MSDDADDYDGVAVHDDLDHLIVFFFSSRITWTPAKMMLPK